MFENDYSRITSGAQVEKKDKAEIYKGFYRAFVVNNNDSERRGRIQVRVPSFHGLSRNEAQYFSDSSLPWAEPGLNMSANFNSGTMLLPEMGSVLWVSFETGTNSFIYFGSMYFQEPKEERVIKYPRTMFKGEEESVTVADRIDEYSSPSDKIIYKSPKGAIIKIDEEDHNEKIQIIDASGQSIELFSNLGTLEKRSSDTKPNNDSYIVIKRTEDEQITIKNEEIRIKAKNIVLEGTVKEV